MIGSQICFINTKIYHFWIFACFFFIRCKPWVCFSLTMKLKIYDALIPLSSLNLFITSNLLVLRVVHPHYNFELFVDFARWCKNVRAAAWPGVLYAYCSWRFQTGLARFCVFWSWHAIIVYFYWFALQQESYQPDGISVAHSSLVACSLYLLTGCISSQWQDLVHVLIAHPKVQIFYIF